MPQDQEYDREYYESEVEKYVLAYEQMKRVMKIVCERRSEKYHGTQDWELKDRTWNEERIYSLKVLKERCKVKEASSLDIFQAATIKAKAILDEAERVEREELMIRDRKIKEKS